MLRATAAASFVAIFALAVPPPVIVLGAGLLGWLAGQARPTWFPAAGHRGTTDDDAPSLLPDDEHVGPRHRTPGLACRRGPPTAVAAPVALLLAVAGTTSVYGQQAVLFSKSAVVTFGGTHAVLGCIAQQAADRNHWISPREMVTGSGLAETAPGPLIMVVQFVAFLAGCHHPGTLSPILAVVISSAITRAHNVARPSASSRTASGSRTSIRPRRRRT